MKSFLSIVTIAGMIIFSSCLSTDDSTNPQQGAFLLSNVSPDAPALSVSLNSQGFGSGLSYGIYTPYFAQTAGSYTITFANGTTTALSNSINIEVGKYYSYFVIDSFSKVKSAFIEDKIILPGADSVYIRFFHFSPNAGPLNFRDSVNATNLFSGRNFNDQVNPSFTSFSRIKAGIYTFQLTQPNNTVVATRQDTLAGGHVYTIFAKGFYGGTAEKVPGIGQIQNY